MIYGAAGDENKFADRPANQTKQRRRRKMYLNFNKEA